MKKNREFAGVSDMWLGKMEIVKVFVVLSLGVQEKYGKADDEKRRQNHS